MKIYTYYIDQKRAFQKEMIDIWARSWKNRGFEPIVLGLEDAMAYDKYEETIQNLRVICKYVTQRDLSSYGEACYARWMAYAALNSNECFFVSDYDVINNLLGLSACEILPKNEITFFQRYCPCLAYGNSNTFKALLEAFADKNGSVAPIQDVKKIFSNFEQIRSYHDQDFLQLNFFERFQENAAKYRESFAPKLNFLNINNSIYNIDPNIYCDSAIFNSSFSSPVVSHISSLLAGEYKKTNITHHQSIDFAKYELMKICFSSSGSRVEYKPTNVFMERKKNAS